MSLVHLLEQRIQILSLKQFKCDRHVSLVHLVIAKENHTSFEFNLVYLFEVTPFLDEFKDIMPEGLLDELPLMIDIQHAMDLAP